MADERKNALTEFVRFAQILRGDEKSEAQTFLDHFFRALGHDGVIEAGATFEFRVAKKPGSPQLELIKGNGAPARSKGGKKFADLLWPDRVLIEMKSRGEKLEKYYDQAFDYWTHIVPKRPPFVILCNFDQFWIYDFNTQLFDPVDRIKTAELPENISTFNFLLPIWKKPIFGNNWVDVTRRAADEMATVFREIVDRGEYRERAQRFILQLLVALVAEDIGLLPEQLVSELLHECADQGASSFDLIGGLFRQMASEHVAPAGRYKGVQYFNGGLFEVVEPIELKPPEAYRLCESAAEDWSKVRPEIFGTLFQDSMDKKERHAFGAHFTSEFDIRKVVGPTIVRPWRDRIDAAGKNVGELRKALVDLRAFRVLDPACGSGNFLFIAYREMKRLERDILLRLREVSKREPLESAISLHQFFGIDIIPFAVELAKVTLMLAKELELIEAQKLAETDQLLIEEKPLPLDNLDKNIICADALFTEWPKADAIIGNPPYLGSRFLAQEHGYEYVRKVHARFPDVSKMADFCTHWFRVAHEALPPGGRAGLVGTNTIRQNESREASLDHIVGNGGVITEAVATQKWSGEAQVSVSIVNWIKGEAAGKKILHTQKGDAVDSPWQIEEVTTIPSTLRSGVDVTRAQPLDANRKPKRAFQGQNPVNAGFFLQSGEALTMLKADSRNAEVIFPYMVGDDLVSEGAPTRWIIDFAQRNLFDAMSYKLPFAQVKESVMPDVVARAEEEKKATGKKSTRWTRMADRWWQFRDYMPGTMAAIVPLTRYIVCPRVTKRPIFEFVSTTVHPDGALMVFPFADDYSFGILQSDAHWRWFKAKCSTLETRYRYTSDTVFDTFPWPQAPTRDQIRAVAEAAVALRALRRETVRKLNYSLRELYRTLEQPGDNPLRDAHARLDTGVRSAYGMPADADPRVSPRTEPCLRRKRENRRKNQPPRFATAAGRARQICYSRLHSPATRVKEDIPAEIRHAAETQFIIRTQIKAALKRFLISPDLLIKAGYTVDAETKDYWAWWSKRLGDRFFDMGTLTRAAAGLETGLRDYFRKKKGLTNLTDLRRLLQKDKRWNGAIFQRIFTWNSPGGAQELFQEELGYDLQSNHRLPHMQELVLHRHLYTHRAGILDDEYIEKWRRLTGEDLTGDPSVRGRYPSEDVYWFRPLRRLGDYINSANHFFRELP